MSSMTTDQLAKRFRVVGLAPSEFQPLVVEIDKWRRRSGEEWTCQRLKAIRQAFIHHSLDLRYEPDIWLRRRSNGVVIGPFGVLFRLPKKRFASAWNALMVYTGFRSSRLTARQWKKFYAGVQRPTLKLRDLERSIDLMELGFETLVSQGKLVIPDPPNPQGSALWAYEPRDALRAPRLEGNVPDVEGSLDSLEWVALSPVMVKSHYGILRAVLDGLELPYSLLFRKLKDLNVEFSPVPVLGRIGVIQEPGCKARIIANPARVWQQAVEPLFRWSARLNVRLPGNFQFDQEAGRRKAQEMLAITRYAMSVDLSGASDYFPRHLTLWLWSHCQVPQAWLLFYQDILNGVWLLPRQVSKVAGKTEVRWNLGQPLGLKPTFNGAFGAHAVLAYGIAVRAAPKGLDPADAYVMVGDDIVWFDEACASLYSDIMQELGVPVAKDKTLESTEACEFLSTLITRDRMYPATKWWDPSDDSFMEFVRLVGPRGIRMLSPRQRRVVETLRHVPEPWGLGWNPHGLPFWERAKWFIDASESFPPVKGAKLRSAGEHHWQLYYNSSLASVVPPGFLSPVELSADQADGERVLSGLSGPTSGWGTFLKEPHFRSMFVLIRDDLLRRSRRDPAYAGGGLPSYLRDSLAPYASRWGWEEALAYFLATLRRVYQFYGANPTSRPLSNLMHLEREVDRLLAAMATSRAPEPHGSVVE